MRVTPEVITSFQSLIEGPLRGLMIKHYPGHMNTYDRFKARIGRHCGFCTAAARHMLLGEVNRSGNDFLKRLESNDFNGYN